MERFAASGERSPRFLRCGHTFCVGCLKGVFDRSGGLQCPYCRAETADVDKGIGPDALPVNYQLLHDMEVSQTRKRCNTGAVPNINMFCRSGSSRSQTDISHCENCENDDSSIAAWGCVNCSLILCNPCTDAHLSLKAFKAHVMVTADDCDRRRALKCEIHKETLEFICDDCKVLACPLGNSLLHSGHNVSSLDDGSTRERARITELNVVSENRLKILQAQLAAVAARIVDNRDNTSQMHEKVKQDIAALVEQLSKKAITSHEAIEFHSGKVQRVLEAASVALSGLLAEVCASIKSAEKAAALQSPADLYKSSQVRYLLSLHLQ